MTDKLLIGTDEAGYGPNLGPLVITATSWRLPVEVDCAALWQHFDEVLTDKPTTDDRRLFVADSKQVYSSAVGLVDLETGVLSFLASLGLRPQDPQQLGSLLGGPRFDAAFLNELVSAENPLSLPIAAFPDEIDEFCSGIRRAFSSTGIRLEQIVSRIVFPGEFNQLVAGTESKGTVLSNCTLQLIRDVCPPEIHSPTGTAEQISAVQVFCDKHGGRNRYDQLISETFGDQFVFRLEESTSRSRYRMGKTELTFRTQAEQFLPVALSSMVSKYLREVLMICFNEFWKQHVPDLRPTKGYPLDAKRFREDIAETARRLNISDDVFWRCR